MPQHIRAPRPGEVIGSRFLTSLADAANAGIRGAGVTSYGGSVAVQNTQPLKLLIALETFRAYQDVWRGDCKELWWDRSEDEYSIEHGYELEVYAHTGAVAAGDRIWATWNVQSGRWEVVAIGSGEGSSGSDGTGTEGTEGTDDTGQTDGTDGTDGTGSQGSQGTSTQGTDTGGTQSTDTGGTDGTTGGTDTGGTDGTTGGTDTGGTDGSSGGSGGTGGSSGGTGGTGSSGGSGGSGGTDSGGSSGGSGGSGGSGSSGDSSGPPSSGGPPSGSGDGSDSGSGKDTAVVPASWSPGGYTALFVGEAPEVRFDDVIVAHTEQVDCRIAIDPRFIEVCEPGSLEVCGCQSDLPVMIGASVCGAEVQLRFAEHAAERRHRVVIRLTGIRRGFSGVRFPDRTAADFAANEAWIKRGTPDCPPSTWDTVCDRGVPQGGGQ